MVEWVNIKSMNRNLDNDILRVKKSELDTFFDYGEGEYLYAVSNGGFGCKANARGSAIFVTHISTNLDYVIKHKNVKFDDLDQGTSIFFAKGSDRWERAWGIVECMVDGGDE